MPIIWNVPLGLMAPGRNHSSGDREVDQPQKQEKWITTLGMDFEPVDMTSLVIVGNQSTYEHNGLMITPRGYEV